MAPVVIHSHTGYSIKADIWSFCIIALELAHYRPPLSHLPPSRCSIMKITQRFRFSDYHDEKHKKNCRNKKFSKALKVMYETLMQKILQQLSYFLVKNVFHGLPSVKALYGMSSPSGTDIEEQEDHEDIEGDSVVQNVKYRRISGWNFNEEVFELDPRRHVGIIIGLLGAETDGEERMVQTEKQENLISDAVKATASFTNGEIFISILTFLWKMEFWHLKLPISVA
ncbi:serine/threonine-protein kinase BLUS1-like [Populus nigra]|uniref:serine/threonine-protein kinase BLUS1-like n=1 Tax=Populus nigra TaxID=3691 RepID=UPI002B26DBB2|nr:serine/threonine-protein kinase BLUS1-like [Populus nigra]